jgi:lysozyme family protein
MSIALDFILGSKYLQLFDTATVRKTVTRENGKVIDAAGEIESLVNKIIAGKQRYLNVVAGTKMPWFFVGLIHAMEGSCNFNTHLYNGDPLTARTVNYPPNKPRFAPANGSVYTFEESAIQSLKDQGFYTLQSWSLPEILYRLEIYNGAGYLLYHTSVPTPYLWSFSNHYTAGKYTADSKWSDTAVSAQPGAATILKRLSEKLPEVAATLNVANAAYAADLKKKK